MCFRNSINNKNKTECTLEYKKYDQISSISDDVSNKYIKVWIIQKCIIFNLYLVKYKKKNHEN